MTENFSNWARDFHIPFHEVNRSPNTLNLMRSSLRHILIKLSKIKLQENLRSSKRKEAHCLQRNPHKGIGRFLSRNLTSQERVGWYIQKKKKNCQPRMLYLTKILFRDKGEISIFQTKAEGFITSQPTLKKC